MADNKILFKTGAAQVEMLDGNTVEYKMYNHTHNYAGSSSAGGAATSVANTLVVKLNGGTTEGTNMFTFNGSAAKSVNITASSIGAAASSHTHNYAGSSSAGGAATSANKVNKSLVVTLNGGTSEGSDKFTFDGSTAKTIDITADAIGASSSDHTHTKSDITDFPTSLKNPSALTISLNGTSQGAYDGSSAKSINITPASIGAAVSSHTHNYAGSSTAGGSATNAEKVSNAITVKLNGGTTEGTNLFTFDGSEAKSVNITASGIGAAASSHTHTKSQITDFPTSLKNPNALTINGTAYDGSTARTFNLATSDHTHSYAGSSSAGGAATSAEKVANSMIVKLNGGTTEGTNMFTFNGSAAKTINITASGIGAAASSHTHPYAGSSSAGGAATSANKVNSSLAISINDGETEDTDLFTFDGSAAKSINLTPELLGTAASSHTHTKSQITDFPTALKNPNALTINGTAYDGSAAKTFTLATSDHTHNYAGSSTAGGAATSANKVNTNLVVKLNGGSTEGTNLFTFNGSTAKTINITASNIGAAATSHTHNYAGSSSAGGAATSANKVNSSLAISINGGTTEDTDLFTFNGSAAKSIDLTPELLGVAASSHTHMKSQITDFPTSLKNPSALTINGTAYDGSAAKTFNLATSDHTHNYAGSSSAGGAATSAEKVANNMVVKLNGGTTEGTNLFTFNGSAAKTVNITASGIGAALSSHTHNYAGSSSAGGAANSVANALTVSLNGTSQGAYNGSAAKSINITPSSIGAAASSHTHTESDISGTISASKISGVLSLDNIPKGALERVVTVADDTARYALTTNSVQLGDTVKVTSTGLMYIVVDESKLTTADGYMEYTAGSAASVPWSGVTGKPSTMKNPNALTINGAAYDGSAAVTLSLATSGHTHNYAGSSSAGGVANSAAKVTNALTVKLNGGSTEGTNLFTFDGSAAKSVNITASGIGAAASSHTHKYAGSSAAGGAATSANKVNSSLAIKLNGGSTEGTDLFTFDGSAAKTVDITASGIGAATSDHTHSYAGSSSVGGAATSALKVANALTINGTTYDGSAAKTFNLATSSHTHNYAGSSSAGGAANSVANNMIVKLNGGTTEDTNLFTFDGSASKTVNITASSIGAAASSHTHNYAGSSSAGGSATSAVKLSTARAIDGVNFNGSAAITHYGACDTASATAAKVVALTNFTLVTGARVAVKFTAGSAVASATLNVNSTGAKAIYYKGTAITASNKLVANNIYEFVYDGTNWVLVGDLDTNTTYTALKNPNALTISLNGTSQGAYDGSAAKSIDITPSSIGAAASSHTHNYAGSSSAGGAATSALKVANALTINGTTYDGSAAKSFTLAASDHTHNYAGSSSAGGAANSVANNMVVKLNGGSTEGTNLFTFNGSAAKTVNITASAIGAAASSHTHNYAGSSSAGGAANSVANSLTINGTAYDGSSAVSLSLATSSHTHNYAASSSAGGAATNVTGTLTNPTSTTTYYVPFHSGASTGSKALLNNNGLAYATLEGTTSAVGESIIVLGNSTASGTAANKRGRVRLYNTSSGYTDIVTTASTSNYTITLPAATGTVALTSSNVASATKVGNSLTIKLNGGSTEGTDLFTFNGSAAKSVNITASAIGAAASSHTHNYAGSSSAGGAATSANKVANALTINGTAYDGSAAKSFTLATGDHTHNYAGSSSAGGAANSVANSMVVKLNGGSTEGTNLFTFNGSAAKTVNITASGIGAAASSHTHKYAGSSSAGGAATSALKVANALTINGTAYDGSEAKSFTLVTGDHTHNYAGSSSAGGAATNVTGTITNPGALTTYYVPFHASLSTGSKSLGHNDGLKYITAEGTASVEGYSTLDIGNSTASGTAGNKRGRIRIYNSSSGYTTLQTTSSSSNVDITFPATSGTVALTSDTVTAATKLSTARTIDGVLFDGSAAITHYGTCSTAAATAGKEVSCTGFSLVTGARIIVKFTNDNTSSSAKLNVNSTGAKTIKYGVDGHYYLEASSGLKSIRAGGIYEFVYDGTNWVLMGQDSSTYAEHAYMGWCTTSTNDTEFSLIGAGATSVTTNGYYVMQRSTKASINPSTGALSCVNLNASGVITQSSDERLKDDFESLSEEFIKAYNELNVLSFVFKNREENDPRAIGVIAQQVLEAFDKYGIDAKEYGIVVERKDGYLGVNYEHLDSLSIMVNQKQQHKIDILEDRLKALEELVYSLMNK